MTLARLSLVALFLALGCKHAAPVVEQAAPTPDPVVIVQRAAAALGEPSASTELRGFRVWFQGSGVSASGTQARSPKATTNLLPLDREYLVDLERERGRRESQQVSPGPIRFHSRAVATRESARTVDLLQWRTGTDIQTQGPPIASAAVEAWTRLIPHGAIHQALKNRSSLRYAGRVERDGRGLDSVTYTDASGATVTLQIDSLSSLPVSASPGEAPNTTLEYGLWSAAAPRLPRRLSIQGATLNEELRINSIDLAPAITDGDFELPPGYSVPPPPGEPRSEKVAEGIFRVEGMPAYYRTFIIVDGNDVTLFDAPQNEEYSTKVQGLIRQVAGPDARVSRVLISHHHADHTGGLAAWVAAGARVVCGSGVDGFLRQRLPEGLRAGAQFEVVTEPMTFGSGARRVTAYPVPNEHADGMLTFHLPGQRLLLQGDLFYIPDRGPIPPAFAMTADLERVIEAHGLAVDTVAGVHGRAGSMEELRASLAKRSGLTQ